MDIEKIKKLESGELDPEEVLDIADNPAFNKFYELLQTLEELSDEKKSSFNEVIGSLMEYHAMNVLGKDPNAELTSRYSEEEEQKIVAVFAVFQPYMEKTDSFEFNYSEKKGFFYAIMLDDITAESESIDDTRIIRSADQLFDFFITSIVEDVLLMHLNGPLTADVLAENEIEEIRARAKPYMEQFIEESRDYYNERFESILDDWNNH